MKKLMINDFKELACQIIFVMNVIILHIIITFYFRYRGIWCCNDYNKDLVKLLFFHDRGPYHIETSPLIYKANPMYWFLYDRDLGHERVKVVKKHDILATLRKIKLCKNCLQEKRRTCLPTQFECISTNNTLENTT